MRGSFFLGVDCGSVSLNLVLIEHRTASPVTLYRRTRGKPLETFVSALSELEEISGGPFTVAGALVTGSGRELLSHVLGIPAVNEITAHAAGAHTVDPRIRTVIEIGGQDSKFIRMEPSDDTDLPRIVSFRMNEICAAGTGAFLDEQADRLGIPVESFASLALQSDDPAPIASRCAVFAKTDMIHQAQEGRPLADILRGVSLALSRNYVGTLIRGDALVPLVSLQGGVMANEAVVKAFRDILGLSEEDAIIPPHFNVLGALGCAVTAMKSHDSMRGDSSEFVAKAASTRSSLLKRGKSTPLARSSKKISSPDSSSDPPAQFSPPFIMGLDVGSVSVKGVIIDAERRIVVEDYRLSDGRPLEALNEVVEILSERVSDVSIYAVTGSGRSLVGRLLGAELIVNEITAQARAAIHDDPLVDTVIEIGGQDSKWISIEAESLKDFEMNRVCAAGTGSFLMEQADRLNIPMGEAFSDAAFSSLSPADLGTKCTVFMESDLVHHQNNGCTSADLSAGVCVSVVRNYLERVANHRPLGERIAFLGGVAANDAVRAAFERETGRSLHSPYFFRVSGALGAALKALDAVMRGEIRPQERPANPQKLAGIPKEVFTCHGCTNRCTIDKYRLESRIVMHGGRCDRWEAEEGHAGRNRGQDLFKLRTDLMHTASEPSGERSDRARSWGMIRSPHFYDLFPFWKAFLDELGVELLVSPPPDREQFENGTRFLRVETCLPMKVMAGQMRELVQSGITTLFHPAILTEPPLGAGSRPAEHCPYIQASSQFLKGSFDVEWIEPVVAHHLDPDSFRNEHLRLAAALGASPDRAARAYQRGSEAKSAFETALGEAGRIFLESLSENDRALVVLGKPYHTSEPFLNMDLGSLFRRMGIKALPADLLPLTAFPTRSPITWKNQLRTIAAARAVARDPRLFPVLITFFGCGPDPFTMKHIKESLKGKPLLVLEMDEHSSRAGVITRIEAFLDRVGRTEGGSSVGSIQGDSARSPQNEGSPAAAPARERTSRKRAKIERIYLPYFGDHAYGFAAAARSVDIEASVLPPPDEESDRSGRPHLMGGECHPYALILGDYLKLVRRLSPDEERRSIFCVPGYSACRLGQYPVYIEKIRKELGHGTRVIADLSQALTAFGLSRKNMDMVRLKTWEGLNSYDVLTEAYTSLRPRTSDPILLEEIYARCREILFQALCSDEIEAGMQEVLEQFEEIPLLERTDRPLVAVTGDYYTRIVPFANNEVYREIERLGGTVLPPPTFSDGLKLYYHQEIVGNGDGTDFDAKASFFASLALSELRIRGSSLARKVSKAPLDPIARRMMKTAERHLDRRYPTGMAAPLATILGQIERGADGVLNLITLNCSYGTVVTAALNRAMRGNPDVPMLTLVYDGLKKTNERTRLEAFMEQVHDHFTASVRRGRSDSRGKSVLSSK